VVLSGGTTMFRVVMRYLHVVNPGSCDANLGQKGVQSVQRISFSTASLIFEILEEGVLRERRKTLPRNPKRRSLRTFVMLVIQMRKTPLVLKDM
jgi:hypothetical protein